jgi:hypothetical protein
VNEKRVENIRQFALALYSFAVGEKATLEIQRGKQSISCQIPVSEKQDLQERLADLITREQAKIPQLGILALTLDDRLLPTKRCSWNRSLQTVVICNEHFNVQRRINEQALLAFFVSLLSSDSYQGPPFQRERTAFPLHRFTGWW